MALELDGVQFGVNDELLVDVPVLSLQDGCVASVVGGSHETRSALVRLIGGHETPSSGVIRWDGAVLGPSALRDLAPKLETLDDTARDAAHALVDRARRDDATAVYATSDHELALSLSDVVVVLHDGALAQAGSSEDLLARPRNTYVARLLGSPPMNMVRAVLEKDGCAVQIGPRSLALPGGVAETYCRNVVVGIRPQHVEVRQAMAGWPARVVATSSEGGSRHVDVDVDGGRLVATCSPDMTPEVGDQVGLYVASRHLLVFDERGERLEIRS